MTITVEGPNGIVVDFPDGTDPATIDGAMLHAAGGGAGAPARPRSFHERFGHGAVAGETTRRFGNYAGVVDVEPDPNGPGALGRELQRRADERLVGEPD